MRTEKMTAAKGRNQIEAEILETCRENPEIILAISTLLDVLKVLRTRYGWSGDQIHGFLEALNEAQEERLREEAMGEEN